MIRTVIIGPSECGKTTLGNEFQKQYAARGIPGLALSIFPNQWAGCHWATSDLSAFLRYASAARGCLLCIDESGRTIDRASEAEWLFTTSRHNDHDVVCMTHGARQLTPTMREQFSVVCMFKSSPKVAEQWAEEFVEPRLLEATTLNQYEFLYCRRFQPVQRLKLAV